MLIYYNEHKTSKNYSSIHFIPIFMIFFLFCSSELCVLAEKISQFMCVLILGIFASFENFHCNCILQFSHRIYKLKNLVSLNISYQFSYPFFCFLYLNRQNARNEFLCRDARRSLLYMENRAKNNT
jgi:hypothetical protein